MAKFIARFDDICPEMDWKNFEIFERFFLKNPEIKPLIGVVPDNRDPMLKISESNPVFWKKVRYWQDRGWVVAQHGYTHEYTQFGGGLLGIGRMSEFAGLPYAEQRDLLSRGKQIMLDHGVWEPYFMAPSHAFDENTLKALQDLGFVAITDGYGVYPYRINGVVAVPQLFTRPFNFGFGIYTLCFHTNSMTKKEIEDALSFMVQNKKDFISFNDALHVKGNPIVSSFSRLATSSTIRLARKVRKLIR